LLLWLALGREPGASQLLLGLALALGVPRLTTKLHPATAPVRRPLVIARYVVTIGYDVLAANLQVAWGILTWRWRRPDARFVVVPLELRDPHGLAALALVTTVVPGTVWSEIALDRSAVMLHVWDVGDEGRFIARYKARYEQPLREIFE
jgi:multicomponent K+:H+ antiporter subunit E